MLDENNPTRPTNSILVFLDLVNKKIKIESGKLFYRMLAILRALNMIIEFIINDIMLTYLKEFKYL